MQKRGVVRNPKAGDRVVRGPDWEYEDQDVFNGVQQPGTITSIEELSYGAGWVYVRWDNISAGNIYRASDTWGRYDLCYYEEEFEPENKILTMSKLY